jgi:DNA-directed RNA polymerase specialized sigma24 family protein
MTTTLPSPLESQLSPGDRMNDLPAASGTPQRDLELLQLVLAIKNSPDRKQPAVRKQIYRLVNEILDRLKPAERDLLDRWSELSHIESIVAEAVNTTLMQVVNTIDSYEPTHSNVMTWIETILDSRFNDTRRAYRAHYGPTSIDNSDLTIEAKIQAKIEADNAGIPKLETAEMANKLRKFVTTDPEGHLSNAQIGNKPDATFKIILLMRIDGLTWQAIADLVEIPNPSTVINFYNTQLRNWNHYFRRYL